MADPQDIRRYAWAIEILGPATVRGATTDLPEAAAVATLGDFYTKRIKNIDTRIVDGLPHLFYGIRRRSGFEVKLDNSDGAMDTTADWRGAPFTLWHYDRETDTRREDMAGLVTQAQFAGGVGTFTLSTIDEAILSDLLPAATINPAVSSPFDDSASPGVPLPVVFGSDVLVKPPSLNVDVLTDGAVSAYDSCAGFGSDLRVREVWGELDENRPGLETFGAWTTAPGSPAYLTTELDPTYRATRFSVTGNQSVRYTIGMPIRFKTTTSGAEFRYSAVKAYDTTTTPHRVEIYDAVIDSGLNTVEIGGDYGVMREVYTAVTTGILPVPAVDQAFTAIRLFGAEDTTMLALVSNPNWPSGSGGSLPSQIIEEIIENNVWGMSTHVQQLCDDTTFGSANIVLALAGLGGVIQGALAYDQRQRTAEATLDAILMMRGMRLGKNAAGRWTLSVDTLGTSVQSFVFGPGAESGTRIKRVLSYGRAPLERAVRNLVLHWLPLGRARTGLRQLNPQEYARFSTKAVSGVGVDHHIYNPFIRSADVAAQVLHYVAEKLIGADEELVFLAGPEARDRVPGEVITCISTVDGFSGYWQITEVSKSLADVQLSCIRQRDQAFDAPSGVTHSAEPSENPNRRTPPGPGPNLVPNPEPAPPLRISDGAAWALGTEPAGFQVPHAWKIATIDGTLTEFSVDTSEAVRVATVSGHYVRMTWSAVTADVPNADHGDGIFSDYFAVPAITDYFVSFYGDAADGWFVNVQEFPSGNGHLLSLVRDATDTSSNGWARLYARWRPQSDTSYVRIGICASAPGTYQCEGIAVVASTAQRRPPDWQRHTVAPATLTRTAAITFDGSTTYTAPLIKAGDYVLGATLRVTTYITGGTHTYYSLGTAIDPQVYAARIQRFTAGETTTSADYKPGTVAAFYADDTNIVLTFNGTVTDGAVQLVLEYTRSAPTPGP